MLRFMGSQRELSDLTERTEVRNRGLKVVFISQCWILEINLN